MIARRKVIYLGLGAAVVLADIAQQLAP